MSHNRIKTTYVITGNYGVEEEHTLYADYNNSCDVATFYDSDGTRLFSIEDTVNNNLGDAIIRLINSNMLDNKEKALVQTMSAEDRQKCGI